MKYFIATGVYTLYGIILYFSTRKPLSLNNWLSLLVITLLCHVLIITIVKEDDPEDMDDLDHFDKF